MTIASEIEDLATNLDAAKTAITTAGGTVGDTGLAGLASEIATIPTGGSSDIGSVKYLDDNDVEQTATIQSLAELFTLGNSQNTWTATIDNTSISNTKITEVRVGEIASILPANFCRGCTALTTVDASSPSILKIENNFCYGCSLLATLRLPSTITTIGTYFCYGATALVNLPTFDNLTSFGNYFCSGCSSLNCPISFPSLNAGGFGTYFLANCTSFNSSLTLPSNMTYVPMYFMQNCSSFNQSLTIPSSVTSFANNFMQGCSAFNQSITIPSGLTAFGNSFMRDCTSFNQPLGVFPEGVTTLGSDFLSGCSSYNQPIKMWKSDNPALSYITSIGQNFMRNCTSFNNTFQLSGKVATIGAYFLAGCTSFNQDVRMPQYAMNSIGNYFMNNCKNMVSNIIVSNSGHPKDVNSLATDDPTAPCYITGITIKSYASYWAQAWLDDLPNSTSSPYRKLMLGSTS